MSENDTAAVETVATSISTNQQALQPQPICWLLRAKQNHPNLNPLDEEDWASLLKTAEAELSHE